MTIDTLINKQDNIEIVRDQIASILAAETVAQQALAVTASLDPADWTFKVYLERARPWNDWIHQTADKTPIVNVALENASYQQSGGNLTKTQQATTYYNIDCYGFAVSSDAVTGHVPGDYAASIEAQRVARLVRNILMSSIYLHLSLTGTVGKRSIDSQQVFIPDINSASALDVVAVRLRLAVQLIEIAPQYTGVPLDYIAVDLTRASDGLVIAETDFDFTP